MSFNYSFNTGAVYKEFNKDSYLGSSMGFSSTESLAIDNSSFLVNTSTFATEYGAKFGKNLAISDNYKLFEYGDMTQLLSSSAISYTSRTEVSRVDAYTEMFLEKFKTGASGTLNVTGTYNTGYQFDNAGTNIALTSGNLATKDQLNALYDQLEAEAAILEKGLHAEELAFGGYPEIKYTSVDAQVELLNKQLETAMQNFVKLYDDMFGYYKIQAGGHELDDQNTLTENETREKEAATAATMAATLAMNYAEQYYSQATRPTAENYVFGQAPLVFSQNEIKQFLVGGVVVQSAKPYKAVKTSPVHAAPMYDYYYKKIDGTDLVVPAATLPATTVEYYNTTTSTWQSTPFNSPVDTEVQSSVLADLLASYSTVDDVDNLSDPNDGIEKLKDLLLGNNTDYKMDYQVFSTIEANRAIPLTSSDYMWDMNDNTNANVDGNAFTKDNCGDKGSFLTELQQAEIGLWANPGPTYGIPAYIEWMVRDSFGVGGLTPDVRNTQYCEESATFIGLDLFKAAEKLVDLKMQIQTKTIESSINNQARAEYEARLGAMEAIKEVLADCTGTDPYTINIDGQNYMLGQDKNEDGTINNITEILGIRDEQQNLFASLKNLDTNNDGYVSQEEMKAHNIILNAVDNESGQLTNVGYDMSLVKGINLADLLMADGTNNVFGKFTMDLQDKKVNGNLTFEDKSYFDNLFASNVDFSVLDSIEDSKAWTPMVIPSSTPEVKETEEVKAEAPVVETATAEPKTFSLFDAKNFSFDFVGSEDNKSAFEKLLDQLSWQMNINNLTSVQKYDILDGIDANQDLAIAKTEIQQELEKINLSA